MGRGDRDLLGDRVLEVFYPDPKLGTTLAPGFSELSIEDAEQFGVPGAQRTDDLRDVREGPVLCVIADLQQPPDGTADAYLRLHLLSHRLVKPRELNMDGIFGALPNIAWTSLGPVDPANLTHVQLKARASGTPLQVFSLDKFPRMTDYVTPGGVRVADADRVRLGAHLAEGTTVMHEGFVNFNAGTLGHSMVEGRISAGVVVGDGSDVGGGSSIMGTLSRRRQRGDLDRRALPARRQRRDRHQPRRRLHGRGRALRHRRHAGHAARWRGRQGPRAQRRQRPALPPQLAHRHGRGAGALGQAGPGSTRRCTRTTDVRRALHAHGPAVRR